MFSTQKTRMLLAGAGLVSLLGLGAFVQNSFAQGQPPAPRPNHRPMARAEKHPEIRHALFALNRAKMFLSKAQHDFGGHREKALDLTEQAIRECQLALQYDKH
ncbi:MAG TPA: hypothetical protein VKV29_10890 [Chthonomonas sp.]|jgi:hypothetical protein|uniref:hypothetical protein n=1 Tax=Chthonomonas sp. TaxID=2282153 RepID=UPI002B4B39FB|nr:hypothetical protein [Chthonomonas sp.]HLH80772.1 hypothetical protein [Chthonomonas sp.]